MAIDGGSESAAVTLIEPNALGDRLEHHDTARAPMREGPYLSTALPDALPIRISGNELDELEANSHVHGLGGLWIKRAWTKAIRYRVPIDVLL